MAQLFIRWCSPASLICAALLLTLPGSALAGFQGGVDAYERGDFATALREFRPLADQGDAPAQYNVGRMFAYGEGVPQDEEQAVKWYRKAADQGYANGQNILGYMYSYGKGVPKDQQQAVQWYRKAADQGYAIAQYNVGLMYGDGLGLPKDDQQAARWYRKAADQGHTSAQYNLGFLYANGLGVPMDYPQAMLWYRKAADQGDARAQNTLGNMYADGRGVPIDEQEADRWIRKAAEQGHTLAQYNLGNRYEQGKGVPKDEQQAVQWFRKAADKGDSYAQFNLGVMYGNGRGVPKDEQQAYFWWLLASAQGNEMAKQYRDRLERQLSSSLRTDAQSAARNWKAQTAVTSNGVPANGGLAEAPHLSASAPKGPASTGSGWAISRTQLVTNAHVVADCGRLVAAGRGAVQVQAMDARSDLALLTVANNPAVAALRSTRLRQGDAVTVVGYPLSGVLASGANVTAGNVSALAGMQNDTRFIQISAPVQPGNSGGPLLDASGNIVGVVVSKLNAMKVAQLTGDIPQNVNFAVSLFTLQGFLEANGVDYATAPSTKRLSTADVAEIGKRFTVLLECYK